MALMKEVCSFILRLNINKESQGKTETLHSTCTLGTQMWWKASVQVELYSTIYTAVFVVPGSYLLSDVYAADDICTSYATRARSRLPVPHLPRPSSYSAPALNDYVQLQVRLMHAYGKNGRIHN